METAVQATFVGRRFWRSILAFALALALMPHLSARAQTTTPYTDPNDSYLTGTQTVTTATNAAGNTVTTTTCVTTGTDPQGNYVTDTYTYSTETDPQGNKVTYKRKDTRTKYDKKGGTQVSNDTWGENFVYNAAGGYTATYDETSVNNMTGQTTDTHTETQNDAAGHKQSGHTTKTTRKPGEKPVKEEQNWNSGTESWENASLPNNSINWHLGLNYNLLRSTWGSDYGSESTNGNAIDATVRTDFELPSMQLTNNFHWEHTNVQYVETGSSSYGMYDYYYDDDYDDCDDDVDDDWGPDDSRGAGIGYIDFHPLTVDNDRYNLMGVGVGINKKPIETQIFSPYGGFWYYPSVSGSADNGYKASYDLYRYDIGVSFQPELNSPLRLNLGYKGEWWDGKGETSGYNYKLQGAYLGLSYKLP